MARKYNVEGTKNFLIAAIILLVLGLWHIKDGWITPLEGHVLYNQITGVVLTIAGLICGYIHKVVK